MDETTEMLSAIAYGEAPVLETMAQMNLDTLELSGLDERTYMIVRIASLIAMDAPPASYFINVEAASDALEPGDLQGILVALAPVVGSARITSAASNILDVFLAEAEADNIEDDIEEAADETDTRLGMLVAEPAPEHASMQAEDEEYADDERELETV